MKLTDEDKIGLSPDEIASLEATDSGQGDELLLVDGKPVVDAGQAEGSAEGAAGEGADAGQADEAGGDADDEGQSQGDLSADELALVETVTTPAPVPAPKFEVAARDFDAEIKAVRTERASLEKQWAEGDLSDEERAEKLADLEDRRDALVREQSRAQTLAEINAQNERNQAQATQQAEDQAILSLMKMDAKAEQGVKLDYANDMGAQQDFDAALSMVKASATHAGKAPHEHVQAAHSMVLNMRGIQSKQPPPPAPTPAAPERRAVPPTLGGLPDAGRAGGGPSDDAFIKLQSLHGEAAERYLAGLPEHEVDRLTRLADAKMFGAA